MPLEIRELHIRVNVNQPQPGTDSNAEGEPGKDKDALINQCIEEMMDILKNKNER